MWTHKRLGNAELRKKWHEKAPEAYKLRNDILHDCDYAADEDQELLNRVEHIREGSSNADLMQDLSDLIVLCNDPDMKQLLEKINFDTTKIDDTKTFLEELGTLLAAAADSKELQALKKLRDQAYTLMKFDVDKICRCGRYVFWKDEKNLKNYRSRYLYLKRHRDDSVEPQV